MPILPDNKPKIRYSQSFHVGRVVCRGAALCVTPRSNTICRINSLIRADTTDVIHADSICDLSQPCGSW